MAPRKFRFLNPFPLTVLYRSPGALRPQTYWVKPEMDHSSVMPSWAIAATSISNPEDVIWLSNPKPHLAEVVKDWKDGFTAREANRSEPLELMETLRRGKEVEVVEG